MRKWPIYPTPEQENIVQKDNPCQTLVSGAAVLCNCHSPAQSWTLIYVSYRNSWAIQILPNFKKYFIYLFLREGKGGRKKETSTMCACLSHTPYWGPGLQLRHVPCLEIELATLWFSGWHSTHWATPARA